MASKPDPSPDAVERPDSEEGSDPDGTAAPERVVEDIEEAGEPSGGNFA